MSIADRNRIEELERRMAALEEKLRSLLERQEVATQSYRSRDPNEFQKRRKVI